MSNSMDSYQQYIALSRYAKWVEDESRRETWANSVNRWWGFFSDKFPEINDRQDIKDAIGHLDIMPSMRSMMTAGIALEQNNIAAYNCSFMAVDSPHVFDETMLILMNGVGCGYSVERQFINKLPEISADFMTVEKTLLVQDSKEGWSYALRELVDLLYGGKVPSYDLSLIRPHGSRLKTFGGRASGPEPLRRLFDFTISTFKKAKGRKLNSLECHDLMCQIADAVISGGTRRSALISLSNLSDPRMRNAKMGQWWESNKNRAFANNSIAFTEKPDMAAFLTEWKAIYDSKSGERGIFNRVAAQKQAEKVGRDASYDFGTNPCGEISLRSKQFCNLSEVVVREDDTLETLKDKVEMATIVGTIQSALADFKYLSEEWVENTKEERLLGVSLTGIYDNKLMNGSKGADVLKATLNKLRQHARETNSKWAEKLNIPVSAAITTVKPSGTVSQLVNSASGIHPRYSEYYIRRVRSDKKDPLSQWMQDKGIPCEVDSYNDQNLVFSFPVKAPEGCVTRHDITAIEHLELWVLYKQEWAEHSVSVTIYVAEDEWLEVGAFVYKHFDDITGVSFLPKESDDHTYQQAPYEQINKGTYNKILSQMPIVDFSTYVEEDDNTISSQEYACTGGACGL